jgi:hypothetical protein
MELFQILSRPLRSFDSALKWSGLVLFLFALLSSGKLIAQNPSSSNTSPQSKFDGPAELPHVYVKSSLADTPAPGKIIEVKADAKLEDVLEAAGCGDTLKLEAGAVFRGQIQLPKKACDDAHWIIIRTSAPDDELPPEGTRLTPCYAGVASLPGRPDFHCASTRNVMAKIAFIGQGGSGPLFFAEGANHYRFVGIEITRESPGVSVVDLIGPKGQVAADHIVFDRVWVHGTAHDETRRGLFLSGTTYMAVVDSYFSDLHCAADSCVDSQAISGASGDLPMGPFKIVNNFLEASGENIILGGAAATQTPADIEIRHNHFFKPLIWMKGQPGFVGGENGKPFIVKNDFELKNAERLLFEGNILENSWGGFSQTGMAILLTAKNPNNLCPLCKVTDITIRYCKVAHVGGAFEIGNVPGAGGSTAKAGERFSIHDVIIDDIDGRKYNGFGAFMVLISNTPTLRDLKMDHITAPAAPRVFLNFGVKNGRMQRFTFTNNLVGASEKDMTSTGGGVQNCVFQPERQSPAGVLNNCVDSVTFTNNAIVGGYGAWPNGNFYPKNLDAVGFISTADGEYRLCHEKNAECKGPSKFVHAGTDGKDIGADVDLVDAAIKGVL